jgi:cysteine-rich repeat protein
MRYAAFLAMMAAGILWSCADGTPDGVPICGDGLMEGGETCDDGNSEGGDGCNKDCGVEAGYSCDGAPSICATVCGDGVLAGEETCDSSNLNGATCETLELGTGDLICDANCELDPSGCSINACGNGELDGAEECDGANMNDETCEEREYDGGSLACTSSCAIDTTGCILFSCGNGIVENVEECDDGNTDPTDGCSANCSVEEGWACVGQPSVCAELCGNGSLDTGEQCDDAALGGQTCESLGQGYVGGTLACALNCTFNSAGCDLPTCGNGVLDTAEQCDGVLLNNQTCETVGAYIGGTLLCLGSCSYNLSGCIPIQCGDGVISAGEACDDSDTDSGDGCNILCSVESGWDCTGEPSTCTPLCGNNTVDSGEQCDGGQLGTGTCQGLGYDTGSLACTTGCTYNTSDCSMFSCGDGMITGIEECDGGDLNGTTCMSLGFVSGQLGCTTNCGFDTSGCVSPVCGDGIITASLGEQCDDNDTNSGDGCNAACQVENGYICTSEPSNCTLSCGNATWDPGEDCDGGDLHGGTCLTLGFPGGTLSCGPTCNYNTISCLDAVCPNAIREGSEECDGSDFGTQDCTSYNFTGGSLSCTGTCTIDTSGCTNAVCGNSAVEAGEECDDGGTASGDGCSATCQWESTCSADETITCGGSDYMSSVSGNDADNYSCSGLGSTSDRVYALTIPAGISSVTADLTCDDTDDDYDLYILEGSCHGELCLDYGASITCDNLTFNVTPGMTYYIVVEEYSALWGGVDLDVSCN